MSMSSCNHNGSTLAHEPDTPAANKKTSQQIVDIKDLTRPSSNTLRRLNALKHNQLRYLEAEASYYDELHQLQSKYSNLYADIFERRKKIVSGEVEPSSDECKWPPKEPFTDETNLKNDANIEDSNEKSKDNETNKEFAADEKENKLEKKPCLNKADFEDRMEDNDDEKGVSNFWLDVLQSNSTVSSTIYDHDEPVLAYLQDIRIKMENEKPASSFSFEFEFAENPYFRNRVLTKTFEFKNQIEPKDPLKYRGPNLFRCIGCDIDWKPKKNVTVKLIKKKIKSKNRKVAPKIITKTKKQGSFFRFFESRANPNEEKDGEKEKLEKKHKQSPSDSHSDSDDSEIERLMAETFMTMQDFAIAECLKNKLIPKAVLYMTGVIEESDSEMSVDEDDDNEDEDDFYEDESDDDGDSDGNDPSDDDDRGRAWGKMSLYKIPARINGGRLDPSDCKQS